MVEAKHLSFHKLLVISLVIVAAMTALSVYAWLALPLDAQLPIHWNIDGVPDRYAGKALALSLLPANALLIALVFALIPKLEPRRAHLLMSSKAYGAFWLAMIGLFAVLHVGLVLLALGPGFKLTPLFGLGLGILFMVMGNFLGKVRSNFFFGIRTPWTLSSDHVWDRTHRMGGLAFFLLGAILLASALLLRPSVFFWVLITGVLAVTLFVVVYSYGLWRLQQRHEDRNDV
ncbi:MAG: SdpI family protein [Pseudomonadota bacterium]